MENNDANAKGARRFAMRGYGVWKFYIACDLDEGILRRWPNSDDKLALRMLYDGNKDEKALAEYMLTSARESAYCIGVELSDMQKARMEELLSPENIESMRGIDERFMSQRAGSFCYRDGWCLDFYAEGDDGRPPLIISDLISMSFWNDQLPFEELESYVLTEVANDRHGAFQHNVAHKVPPGKTREIIQRALTVGIDAIDEILWYGTERLLRELDCTEIGRHLSYRVCDDGFTVKYGNMTSRACKVVGRPRCEAVFGREHVFEQ